MATKNKTQQTSFNWLDEDHEVPTVEAQKMQRGSDLRFKLFRWVLMACPWAFVITLVALLSLLNQEDPKPAKAINNTDSPHKIVAITAVKSWLDEKPSPLPGASFVSWDKVEPLRKPKTTSGENGSKEQVPGSELHYLTASTSDGQDYTITVQVDYSPTGGAKAARDPSVIPQVPVDTNVFSDVAPWGDKAPSTSASDASEKTIDVWAQTLFSGDPEQLKLTVGDGADNHGYMPMPKADVEVEVGDATLPKGEKEPEDEDTEPKRQVVQVQITPKWSQNKGDDNANLPSYSYDVLLTGTDTSAPKVVAWGAPGSGRELKAYANAIKDRPLTSDEIKATQDSSESDTTDDTDTEGAK